MSRPEAMRKVRCAVYTGKSGQEGVELAFNSLDAQREACAAYIDRQRHEGWLALDDHDDDGGYSGGTLERPALQRLIRDIEAPAEGADLPLLRDPRGDRGRLRQLRCDERAGR